MLPHELHVGIAMSMAQRQAAVLREPCSNDAAAPSLGSWAAAGRALTARAPRAGASNGSLRLNAAILANIYLCTVTRWNDPAIAALNPNIRRAPCCWQPVEDMTCLPPGVCC